ncbi:MAG: HD domain-containing protein [Rhodocyclaceae bacterium]|nr:HD domain-containing protein [Rhodocyclaceae bacterium]
MSIKIDLKSAVLALSDALDLVGVNDFQHGKRVAVMAREVGLLLGLPARRLDDLFCAGLLHDLGVSCTTEQQRLAWEWDWAGRDAHCRRGHDLLRPFAHLSRLAEVIRYHHTPWPDLPDFLSTEDALATNLILLADRVDALLLQRGLENPLVLREGICAEVGAMAGRELDAEVVRAFRGAATREAFWIGLAPRHVLRYLADMALPEWRITIEFPQFRHVARLVSSIVDAKSPFTASHSMGVAQLARHLGERAGLDPDAVFQVEVAGLMHDVGKLCVPDEIVEKPARLTATEFSVMERHSFETYQILRHIPGMETIAEWAAFHHEALNGRGYPFRHGADRLHAEARIVAVADVFQALSQTRPYRGAHPPEEIPRVLDDFVARGVLDPDLVDLACGDLDACWRAATQTH